MHALALLLAAIAAAPAVTSPAVAVARGVYLIPGAFVPGQQPDGNSVVFTARHALVVVDTGRHASHTKEIVDVAQKLGKPVAAVVNTHWHLDHIGGNALLRHDYPQLRVYASAALADARKGFLEHYRGQLQEMIAKTTDAAQKQPLETELQLVESSAALAPDVVVDRSQTLNLAGRTLEVHLETRAVTAGDLWLYDRSSRVLVSGDLVTLPVPFLDTACAPGWSAALDHLHDVDFAVLVPGHGAPMSRVDFETYRAAFRNFVSCAASRESNESCVDGWMHDAAPLLKGADPRFVRSLADYYVGSVLRGDPSKLRDLCGNKQDPVPPA